MLLLWSCGLCVFTDTWKRHTEMATMQSANRLQRALKTGSGLTFGAWQMLPGSNQARTIANCGFDWIVVDTEHGNIDGALVPISFQIGMVLRVLNL